MWRYFLLLFCWKCFLYLWNKSIIFLLCSQFLHLVFLLYRVCLGSLTCTFLLIYFCPCPVAQIPPPCLWALIVCLFLDLFQLWSFPSCSVFYCSFHFQHFHLVFFSVSVSLWCFFLTFLTFLLVSPVSILLRFIHLLKLIWTYAKSFFWHICLGFHLSHSQWKPLLWN